MSKHHCSMEQRGQTLPVSPFSQDGKVARGKSQSAVGLLGKSPRDLTENWMEKMVKGYSIYLWDLLVEVQYHVQSVLFLMETSFCRISRHHQLLHLTMRLCCFMAPFSTYQYTTHQPSWCYEVNALQQIFSRRGSCRYVGVPMIWSFESSLRRQVVASWPNLELTFSQFTPYPTNSEQKMMPTKKQVFLRPEMAKNKKQKHLMNTACWSRGIRNLGSHSGANSTIQPVGHWVFVSHSRFIGCICY